MIPGNRLILQASDVTVGKLQVLKHFGGRKTFIFLNIISISLFILLSVCLATIWSSATPVLGKRYTLGLCVLSFRAITTYLVIAYAPFLACSGWFISSASSFLFNLV